jgi:hypothetical protein
MQLGRNSFHDFGGFKKQARLRQLSNPLELWSGAEARIGKLGKGVHISSPALLC